MITVENLLIKAYRQLKKIKIRSYKIDSEILLAKVLKTNRLNLILKNDYLLEKKQIKNFKSLIKMRKIKLPIAYLVGEKEFWKSKFLIDNKVLIPRPDSEFIVEETLKLFNLNKSFNLLDIGTGSGCLIISILKERINSYGIAIDISKHALKLAKNNAKIQHVANRIKFINSDIDKFNHGKYDLIISNPPYLNKVELNNLDEEIKYNEPILSLKGGLDGNKITKKVIDKSKNLLKKKGKLIIEIGHMQKLDIIRYLKINNFIVDKVIKNYNNYDRCIVSTKI